MNIFAGYVFSYFTPIGLSVIIFTAEHRMEPEDETEENTMKKQSNYDSQVDVASRIFLDYDQEQLIRKFNLQADEQWIYLTYMNTPCRIHIENGQIEEFRIDTWMQCRDFSTVMTIFDLLCYHKGPNAPILFHQWCTVGTFIVTGVSDTGTFTRKYAALFDGHMEKLRSACESLGGIPETGKARADVTYRIPVTHFFPVLLQFWEGDEEFPPKLQLMWDRNADSFLHFETTFYLQGDLLARLKNAMEL